MQECMTRAAALQAVLKLTRPALMSLTVFLLTLYFAAKNAHFYWDEPPALGKYAGVRVVLLLHIAAGTLALLLGPAQFWDELRRSRPGLHRAMGMAYVGAIALSAPCAFYLSLSTAYEVGFSYALALQIWVSVWMLSTTVAFRFAWQKKFGLHKEWMVRSYLASLAFVVSALLLKIPFVARQGSFAETSPVLFFLGWAVPYFLYDLMLSLRRVR
jgi:Predicted membrane protein (DUF2306)